MGVTLRGTPFEEVRLIPLFLHFNSSLTLITVTVIF